jgi:hypothetical protein
MRRDRVPLGLAEGGEVVAQVFGGVAKNLQCFRFVEGAAGTPALREFVTWGWN